MREHKDTLFQIGEVTKALGITRKTLLVYEEAGLLTPAMKNEQSGYRYYSADNMMQIKSIRALQKLGLTLKEVEAYYSDTENLNIYLQNLIELRATLDRNIQRLQARAAAKGDLTIHKTVLPAQVCFCRRYLCNDISEASDKLRETYIAAVQTGKSSKFNLMFTQRMSKPTEQLDLMCCIPIDWDFDGPERMEFAETHALCVYYRGPYEKMQVAIQALMEYLQKHNIRPIGPFRSIYLEGPPNHGANSANYITQIAVPIQP